jgi:DNA-binding CsgD family transcriptional regulator/tetratricopeptide (TPR) repeat protein
VTLARQALERRAPGGSPRRIAAVHNQLGRYHGAAGRREQAAQSYWQALDGLDGAAPSAERARALGAWRRSSSAGPSCAPAATSPPKPSTWPAGSVPAPRSNVLGLALAHTGELEAGLAELRQALARAEEIDDADDIAMGYINTGYVLDLAGRHADAAELALRGQAEMRRLGLDREAGTFLQANAAGSLFAMGRWEQAATLLAEAAERGARSFAVLLYCARLATARGEFPLARHRLAQLEQLLRDGGFTSWRRYHLEQVAETATGEGRLADVRSAVRDGLALYAGTGEPHFAVTLLATGLRAEADAADRARAARCKAAVDEAVAAGDHLVAEAHTRLGVVLDPDATVLPDGRATVLTALAERHRLHDRAGSGPWSAAATAWDELGRPFPAAYARFRAAETTLRRHGPDAHTTATLRRAAEVAGRLGATPLRTECELLARRHRVSLDAAPGTGTPAAGPDAPAVPPAGLDAPAVPGLTDREQEILALVAVGRTNGEIAHALVISPKTVSVHVSNILRKFGATGRADAARIAHRTGRA